MLPQWEDHAREMYVWSMPMLDPAIGLAKCPVRVHIEFTHQERRNSCSDLFG